ASKNKHKFKRYHSWRYKRVKPSWRRPRGIDNCIRRKFRGAIAMPGKGYKTENCLKHLTPCGFRKVMVANVGELESLIGLNNFYCAEIRHAVGAKKRIEIVNRADELGIKVLNREGRIIAEND
ncbi:Ribosomal protein L32e, partial [Trinorchestia longiramus]